MYYYPFLSSRASTILWGRLVTCGRLGVPSGPGLLASLTNAAQFAACLHAGQVGNLRPIVNRPALWGGQSWLQLAFSRLLPPVNFGRERRSRHGPSLQPG